MSGGREATFEALAPQGDPDRIYSRKLLYGGDEWSEIIQLRKINRSWYDAFKREQADRLHDRERAAAERHELIILRGVAARVAAQSRPAHEHYEGECALCDLYVALGLETREEQDRGE